MRKKYNMFMSAKTWTFWSLKRRKDMKRARQSKAEQKPRPSSKCLCFTPPRERLAQADMRRWDWVSSSPWRWRHGPSVSLSASSSAVLKLRHSREHQHGDDSGQQVWQFFGFSHQDSVGPGVLHPVLLPQEGKTIKGCFIFKLVTVVIVSALTKRTASQSGE